MHKKLEERFENADDVVLFHLQTVFEGHSANTADRGPKEAQVGALAPFMQDVVPAKR